MILIPVKDDNEDSFKGLLQLGICNRGGAQLWIWGKVRICSHGA